MSFEQLLSNTVQFALVVGIAFGFLCLVASVLRFQEMVVRAREATPDDADGADAFRALIAARLGTAHREPDPFLILLIGLANGTSLQSEYSSAKIDEAMGRMKTMVRKEMRCRDTLLRIGEPVLGILVGGPRHVGAEIVSRIHAQCCESSLPLRSGEMFPFRVGLSVASFPEDGDRVESLLGAAYEVLAESMASSSVAERLPVNGMDEPVMDRRPRSTPEHPLAGISADQHRFLDPLTGILLKEHLGSILQKRISQFRKDGESGTVLTLLVDHLDRYLDHYGPEGIETIFRHVGSYLQGAVREQDLLGRFEEDQIVIILACSSHDGLIVAQRIAKGIKRLEVSHGSTPLKLTVSVGLAGFPDHGSSSRKLLELATFALNMAKARGRNLCLAYDPEMEESRKQMRDATAF